MPQRTRSQTSREATPQRCGRVCSCALAIRAVPTGSGPWRRMFPNISLLPNFLLAYPHSFISDLG